MSLLAVFKVQGLTWERSWAHGRVSRSQRSRLLTFPSFLGFGGPSSSLLAVFAGLYRVWRGTFAHPLLTSMMGLTPWNFDVQATPLANVLLLLGSTLALYKLSGHILRDYILVPRITILNDIPKLHLPRSDKIRGRVVVCGGRSGVELPGGFPLANLALITVSLVC